MERIISTPDITIYQGLAAEWPGDEHIDLVFTNPYGYLPSSLVNHPMVLHQWIHRKRQLEVWAENLLTHCVGVWNHEREAFWSAHYPRRTIDISEFVPEPGGWYPEDLVRRLLPQFVCPGQTVWDGFMGRGTVAKVCRC